MSVYFLFLSTELVFYLCFCLNRMFHAGPTLWSNLKYIDEWKEKELLIIGCTMSLHDYSVQQFSVFHKRKLGYSFISKSRVSQHFILVRITFYQARSCSQQKSARIYVVRRLAVRQRYNLLKHCIKKRKTPFLWHNSY